MSKAADSANNGRPLLLDVEEAAELLRIHPSTLRKHVRHGISPVSARRIGRRLMFSAAEIERYANGVGS